MAPHVTVPARIPLLGNSLKEHSFARLVSSELQLGLEIKVSRKTVVEKGIVKKKGRIENIGWKRG